jgi:hypothetical protein
MLLYQQCCKCSESDLDGLLRKKVLPSKYVDALKTLLLLLFYLLQNAATHCCSSAVKQ